MISSSAVFLTILLYRLTILITFLLVMLVIFSGKLWTWCSLFICIFVLIRCQSFLNKAEKQAEKQLADLMENINKNNRLSLDGQYKLGNPNSEFLVFDKKNRALAFCASSGKYRIYNFSHVRRWEIIWKKTEPSAKIRRNGKVRISDGHETDFAIRIHVNDIQQPFWQFRMSSREQAEEWASRLDQIFNH